MEHKNQVRYSHLDLLKFMAIFFVLIYHLGHEDDILTQGDFIAYFRYFIRGIWATCVPIFFFVNGYLLINSSMNLKKHTRKTLKIIFLTFTWAFIMVFALMLIRGVDLSTKEILKTIWKFKLYWTNHLWFLGALACIYFLYPLIKCAWDYNRKVFIYFTVVASVLTLGNVFINDCANILQYFFVGPKALAKHNWFSLFTPFRGLHEFAFVYFCLGAIAKANEDKILAIAPRKRNLLAILVITLSTTLLFLLGIVLTFQSGVYWDNVYPGFPQIPTVINVLAFYVLSLSYQRRHAFIELVSKNTLGIYLIHMIIINLLLPLLDTAPNNQSLLVLAAFATVVLILSLGATIVISKIPILKQLVRL